MRTSAETFDRILMLDTLEHLRDPGKVLKECRGC